jgi:hypothetical protein
MPSKKSVNKPVVKKGIKSIHDFAQWNFIIFLTLAFILLVVVLNAMTNVSTELRSRAFNRCPELTAPRAEDCPGGWTFKRGADGCTSFFCETKE